MTVPPRFEPALLSPVHVANKDGEGWVGLFHPDGFVEDPVEAGRYQGTAQIRTFWDVFIGPQPSVAFDVKRDFVGGNTLIRQCTVVNVTQADDTEKLRVPALIQYTIRDGQVGSLQAVWEPRGVIGWFAGRGRAGLSALTKHGIRMMSKAGLRNGLSFGGTLVGGLGARRANELVDAVRSSEARRWAERLGGARVTIGHDEDEESFTGEPERALDCLQSHTRSLSRMAVDQVLVCGNHVGAFLVDEDGGALALLLRASGGGAVESLAAIWAAEPAVLTLPARSQPSA